MKIKTKDGYVVQVDDTCAWLGDFSWYTFKTRRGNTRYAARMTSRKLGARKVVLMHRVVLGYQNLVSGERSNILEVDHKNGDGLDNRGDNLRPANRYQQMMNTKRRCNAKNPYRGVLRRKDTGKWRAIIQANGKVHLLGDTFETFEEALVARQVAEVHLHGEYRRVR